MASRFPSSQPAQPSVNRSSLSPEDADQTTLPEHQVIPDSSIPTDSVDVLGMTGFSEKQQSLMKDILQMKNEIDSLENQLESVQQMCPDGISMEELDRTLSDMLCAQYENPEELVPLTKDLALQESLTGILLEDIVVKKMDHGDACIEKLCRLTGSCGDIAFLLDFNIEEKQDSEDQSSKARITSLKIKTEDPSDNLRERLASFEKDLSIQGFFKMMVPYTEWKSHRRTAFEHFKKKYPEMISLPDDVQGTKLQIKATAFHNSCWIVTWDILLLETYEVHQSLQLAVGAKKTVLRMDRENLLASIPEIFQKMLETLGIEGAIEAVIKFACK